MLEWDKDILGPIMDTQGVEQGGVPSDKIYRLGNNEQLVTAQQSELGVELGSVATPEGLVRQVLGGVGLADDVALLAGSLTKLQALLHLTRMYCDKFLVKLVASKTKMLVYTTKHTELQSKVELATTTIKVDEPSLPPRRHHMLVSCVVLRVVDPTLLLACQPIGKLCLLCCMLVWQRGIGQTLLPPSGLRLCLLYLSSSLGLPPLC